MEFSYWLIVFILTLIGQLAQLVSALPSHGRGHWFESSIAHSKFYIEYLF